MANSKFERSRSELEIIFEAGEKFYRGDQRMSILYRLHNLPYNRVNDNRFIDQDFVLNLTIGDMYILAQEVNGDRRPGDSCYYGNFESTVDKSDSNVLPPATATWKSDGDDDDSGQDYRYKKQRLHGDCYSKYVDPKRHCQVGRDKSGLWIKDLGSQYGTFVNGSKLEVDVCRVLKSGDVISLGFNYEENKPWMLEIGRYWVFKLYEVPESEFEHREKVATEAMENPVILDTIFSNFGCNDLKCFRSVSPLWDEAANKKLRSLAQVVFSLYEPYLDLVFDGSWSEGWIERAQKKLSALQNIGIRSISIKENNSTLDFPTERLLFLQNILANNQISSVELDFLVGSENVTSLFKSILSCPQLLEVTFNRMLFAESHEYEDDDDDEEEELGSNVSVQKLIFKKSQSDYSKILQFFPNAREIVLQTSTITDEFLDIEDKNQLERVKVLIISNEENQTGGGGSYHGRCTSGSCHCGSPESGASGGDDENDEIGVQTIGNLSPLICALPKSLQLVRLEITDLYDVEGTVGSNTAVSANGLFNLLSKFKNSLQYLKLGLHLNRNSHIQFPEMKVLRVFKLNIQDMGYSGNPSFTSGFGSEIFPRLKMLQVDIYKMAGQALALKFVKTNFGSVSDFINVSVRQLRFVFPSAECKNKYSQLAERNFREIFPNCASFDFDCNN